MNFFVFFLHRKVCKDIICVLFVNMIDDKKIYLNNIYFILTYNKSFYMIYMIFNIIDFKSAISY